MTTRFEVWVGDEIGCFKHIRSTSPAVSSSSSNYKHVVNVSKSQNRNRSIVSATFSSEEEIVCSRRDGSVQVYRNDVEVKEFEVMKTSKHKIVSAEKISDSRILVCDETGLVTSLDISSGGCTTHLKHSANGYTKSKPIEAFRIYKDSFYALGGIERGVKVYDASTGNQTWKSKNVPNDFLSLRVPIYVSDLRILKDGHRILTATAYGQIRMYDMREDNHRPIFEISNGIKKNGAARVVMEGWKSLAVDSTETRIVAGDRAGNMIMYELRQGLRMLGKFNHGIAGGSIRDIECHPTRPYVASVGLDRYLRVHDMKTRRLVSKMYLRQRLNAVVFKGDAEKVDNEEEEEEDKDHRIKKSKTNEEMVEDEEDSMWARLDRNTIRFKKEMKQRREERRREKEEETTTSKKNQDEEGNDDEGDDTAYTFYLKVSGEGLKRSLRGQGELRIESTSNIVRGTYTLEKSTGGTYNGLLEGKRDSYALTLETSAMIGDARRRLSQLDGVINEKE